MKTIVHFPMNFIKLIVLRILVNVKVVILQLVRMVCFSFCFVHIHLLIYYVKLKVDIDLASDCLKVRVKKSANFCFIILKFMLTKQKFAHFW